MKRLITILLLVFCISIVKAGELEDFQKERQTLINRVQEYETIIQNVKYRVAQLDALIDYVQKQETKKKDKKKKKKDKKEKKKK